MINYAQALGLGGLNPTAIAQQTKTGNQAIAQNEMNMQAQQKIQELAPLAAKGDASAIAELHGYAPNISQGIQNRYDQIAAQQGAQQADAMRKATGEFFVQYKQADPETRKQLTLAAEQNPLIDFDREDYAAIENGNDLAVDFGIIEHYDLDTYKQMFGEKKLGAGYSDVRRGEDGQMYGINKQTNRYERIPSPEGVAFSSSGQNINIDTKGATEEEKVVSKAQGEMFNETQLQARTAREQQANLNALESLSDKAFSGTGAGAKKAFAKAANTLLGIDVEGLAETEIFDAIANELVLGKTSMMTGVLTDKDMAFLQDTVPQLNQTPEGRKQLIQIAKKVNQRRIQYGKEAAEFRKENGRFSQYEFDEYLKEKNKGKDFLAEFYPTTDAGTVDFAELSIEELQAIAFPKG